MNKLKYNTFVGNTGHFDNEVDVAGSDGFEGTELDHIKPKKIVLVSPVGHSVIMMRRLKSTFHRLKKKKCGVRPPAARWKFPP